MANLSHPEVRNGSWSPEEIAKHANYAKLQDTQMNPPQDFKRQLLLALALFLLPTAVVGVNRRSAFSGLVLSYLVYFFDGSEYKPWSKFWPAFYKLFRWSHTRNLHSFATNVQTVFVNKGTLVKHPKVIYSLHPHGVMSMCHPQAFFSIPHETCKLAASVCFKVPLMREAYLWSGMIDAGRPTCMKALEHGFSLTIVVGGTREQLIPYSPTHDTALCKSRKGFIKLARDAGRIPIVPCYSFGESIAYETSDFLLPFRRWLQRRIGVGWAIAKTWRPRRLKDFVLVVGTPIEWEEEDTVETIHRKYITAVKDLFYEHRGHYVEYADRELLIK